MNFVFISPNFPDSYYRFCKALKNNGVTVLGIGDTPFYELNPELRESLAYYYYVSDLKNMDEKRNAMNFFINNFGPIDFIESNNEFWLEDDAKLRTEFNISTGPKTDEISYFKYKSQMKKDYEKANIKTARWLIVKDKVSALKFIEIVGYPVIVKPDNGVGASRTYSIKNQQDLDDFFASRDISISYIMEEFINGLLISFDGVCDSKGNAVYPTHHVFPTPIMDVVNEERDCVYYTSPYISKELMDAGQRVLHAFGAKSRFFHLEFFILNEDKKGLGNKGDLIGLEVNMRVPGGYTPDLINYAYSVDVYQIWADVIAFDKNRQEEKYPKTYCCYVGRRNSASYLHSYEEIMCKYMGNIMWNNVMPHALSDAMGNYFFMAKFDDEVKMNEYIEFSTKRR